MAVFTNLGKCDTCRSRSFIFDLISEQDRDLLNRSKQEVSFNAGEIIFKQGAMLTHIVCVTSGLAKIYFEGVDRKNLILRLVKPSELVGGPGMFVDQRHHYSLGAVEDTLVCFIELGLYRELVFRNKPLAHEVMARESQHRIELYEKLVNLTQKQMPGRVAEALLYLSKQVYNSSKFLCTISRQELADLTAMSKESAIRILKDFKENNLVSIEGNQVELLDVEGLMSVSARG
ncbi:MAG: Crp/Fnr family transcriptional regulator [Bacteroidales bacterium]|nr:Crp/Fnr family transcriptional regulator [Bacteroidales bacterium]MDD3663628.1 Crp/Fnr family transcriptional regulator [Bacteroidales bacterium]